jgi:tetratricopeptide (TPR) repeat protein
MIKKIAAIISFLGIFILSNAQELSPKAKDRLSQISKKYNDTIDIKSPEKIFEIGYWSSYFGMDDIGEEMMQHGIHHIKNLKPEMIRHSSVQNTKNGYWVQAIQKLDEASELDPSSNAYYGWVLLFFYHDYKKSLEKLELYEVHMNHQPNLVANGDNFHYLKGLNYMQLNQYERAIQEFDWNIKETYEATKENNFFPYQVALYKARCLDKLGKNEEALKCYDLANSITKMADNYYYKAILLKKMNRFDDYQDNIRLAFDLIKNKVKNNDNYQVVFDEIYIQDVEKELNEINVKNSR